MDRFPATLEECHKAIQVLLDTVTSLSKRFETLELENQKLRLENAQLKERLNNNSDNSSLPPSKSLKKKKNNRISSGKKSGGQPGHKGRHRELLPSKQVDKIEICKLDESCICGGSIKLSSGYVRHQVHELPELKLQVTEYQLQQGCCGDCHCKYVASLPESVTWGITGPRLTGFMSELTARYGLSRSEQRTFLKEMFSFSISLGTIFKKQKIVNAAMEFPVQELLPIVKESKVVNSDETGHHRDGKNQWMWAFMSDKAAFFSIEASRGKKVLRSFLGDFKNIVISDRYAAYNIFESHRRQICWAHLKRDFTKLAEKENKIISRIGKQLLECESQLFKFWHQFKSNHLTPCELQQQTRPIRKRVGELLEQGSYTDPLLRVSRFCKNLLEYFNALWTFLDVDGVEPTNNHAERSLRPSVIWRKKYFCTRSDYGSEFVSRSASIITTCKFNKKRSFEFLTTLMTNHFSGRQTSAQLILA